MTNDDGGYELGFYARVGESYQLIDKTQVVIGSHLPTVAADPTTRLPALRAQMRPTDDACFFFVKGGKLQRALEHPEEWTTVKEPSR